MVIILSVLTYSYVRTHHTRTHTRQRSARTTHDAIRTHASSTSQLSVQYVQYDKVSTATSQRAISFARALLFGIGDDDVRSRSGSSFYAVLCGERRHFLFCERKREHPYHVALLACLPLVSFFLSRLQYAFLPVDCFHTCVT